MAELLRGKPVADKICEQLQGRVKALAERGITPKLAIIRVGARDDDLSYERAACKRCEALGIGVQRFELPADCAQEELEQAIAAVNEDASIHGCLMFRPLPGHLDEQRACSLLDPSKDVDGITAASMAGVFCNSGEGFAPCTAEACVRLLQHYEFDLDGADIVVIGRSLVIGKPVAALLLKENATVTTCHTHTRDLDGICRRADAVVVASGHAGTLGSSGVSQGQTIVDVGMNWDDAAGKFVGDVSFDEVEPIVAAITPVPGGVGSITTAVLAEHVVQSAE